MPKPNKYWQERLNKAREKAMEDVFGLQQEAFDHIKDSLRAAAICKFCSSTFTAPKTNAEGKCLSCNGTGIIPDVEQRNWAVEQVISRTLPKPKQLEASIDTNVSGEDGTKLESLSDEQLKKVDAAIQAALEGGKDGQE